MSQQELQFYENLHVLELLVGFFILGTKHWVQLKRICALYLLYSGIGVICMYLLHRSAQGCTPVDLAPPCSDIQQAAVDSRRSAAVRQDPAVDRAAATAAVASRCSPSSPPT